MTLTHFHTLLLTYVARTRFPFAFIMLRFKLAITVISLARVSRRNA